MNAVQNVLDIYDDRLNRKREGLIKKIVASAIPFVLALLGLKSLFSYVRTNMIDYLSKWIPITQSSLKYKTIESPLQKRNRIRDDLIHQAFAIPSLPPAANSPINK
jgi:hypothetical protein